MNRHAALEITDSLNVGFLSDELVKAFCKESYKNKEPYDLIERGIAQIDSTKRAKDLMNNGLCGNPQIFTNHRYNTEVLCNLTRQKVIEENPYKHLEKIKNALTKAYEGKDLAIKEKEQIRNFFSELGKITLNETSEYLMG